MMTGSNEAALQASIASFSDAASGLARVANHIIQTWTGLETDNSAYPDMHVQSPNVAQSELDGVRPASRRTATSTGKYNI